MPGDPNECRQHAVNCTQLAAAADGLARETLIGLAVTWDRLASELESAQLFLSAMKAIEPGKLDGATDGGQAPESLAP